MTYAFVVSSDYLTQSPQGDRLGANDAACNTPNLGGASSGGRDGTEFEQQIATLLVAHFPRLWRIARRMGLDAMRAEEAAQEAFVILFEKQALVTPGKELAFLISAVTHVSQNMRRKLSYTCECPVAPDLIDIHPALDSLQQLLERKQTKELVDGLIASLSEPLRVVLILFELEGLTLQEISDTLQIPLGTAASRLRLARKAFQQAVARMSQCSGSFEEVP